MDFWFLPRTWKEWPERCSGCSAMRISARAWAKRAAPGRAGSTCPSRPGSLSRRCAEPSSAAGEAPDAPRGGALSPGGPDTSRTPAGNARVRADHARYSRQDRAGGRGVRAMAREAPALPRLGVRRAWNAANPRLRVRTGRADRSHEYARLRGRGDRPARGASGAGAPSRPGKRNSGNPLRAPRRREGALPGQILRPGDTLRRAGAPERRSARSGPAGSRAGVLRRNLRAGAQPVPDQGRPHRPPARALDAAAPGRVVRAPARVAPPVRDLPGRDVGRALPNVRVDPPASGAAWAWSAIRSRRAGVSAARCGKTAVPAGREAALEARGVCAGSRGGSAPGARPGAAAGMVSLPQPARHAHRSGGFLQLIGRAPDCQRLPARSGRAMASPRDRAERDSHEHAEEIEQLLVSQVPFHETRDQESGAPRRDPQRNRG